MNEKPYDVKWAIQKAREAVDTMEKEYDKLSKVADGVSGKVMSVDQCKFMGGVMASISSYSSSSYGVQASTENVVNKAKKDAEERIAKDRETHQKNIPAIENNRKLREQIKSVMKNAGIPDTYSTPQYKSSRSRSPTYIKHNCGWAEDLERFVTVNDGIENSERIYADTIRKIEEYKRIEQAKEEEKEKIKKIEQEKAESLRELAVFQVRYNLPATATWSDVLDEIISKDKYLHLAHFLQQNRMDWNDGPNFAECGLSSFKADSKKDIEIVNCIKSLIDNWDGDGRCFRDCEWNYDRVFGMADNKLLEDYNVVFKRIA